MRKALLVFCALPLFQCGAPMSKGEPAHAEPDAPGVALTPLPVPGAIVDQLDALFADYQQPGAPGASVLVVQNGRVQYERGFGLANLDTGAPVGPRTAFRLSSMTKQLTAMTVMIARERGMLMDREGVDRGYELTLDQVFDGGSARFGQISVRQLLTHTSGLPDYFCPAHRSANDPMTDAEVLDEMKNARPEDYAFPAGTKYEYSNAGYSVLSSLVAETWGKPFPEVLRQQVFAPLGMQDSLDLDVHDPAPIADRAFGYQLDATGFHLGEDDCSIGVLGDGNVYSTVRDLERWDASLYPDAATRLVAPATLVDAFTSHTPPDGDAYGYGWSVGTWQGLTNESHGGATSGFRSRIERFPQLRFTVIVLVNREDQVTPDNNYLWQKLLGPITTTLLFSYRDLPPEQTTAARYDEQGALLNRDGLDDVTIWKLESKWRMDHRAP